MCFVCGEKWSKDHVCKQEVQLHVVQEMLEYVQQLPFSFDTGDEDIVSESNAVYLSATAVGDTPEKSALTMKLKIQLQGRTLSFLVDLGSTHTFLDGVVAELLQGVSDRPVSVVRVANGKLIPCSKQLLNGEWACGTHQFVSDFRIFFRWALMMVS